jgi:DNA-binding transcriptional MerR regulator
VSDQTRARYRRYAVEDLRQIERILALKSLGLSLNSITLLLQRGPVGLDAHRAALRKFMADAARDRWEATRQRVAVLRPPDRAPASAIALFREIAGVLDHLRPSRQPPIPLEGTEAANVDMLHVIIAGRRDALAPETHAAWSRRADWPSGLRRYVASCYEMEPDALERVVAAIEAHGTR